MLTNDFRAWHKQDGQFELHVQRCYRDPQNPWQCVRCFYDVLTNSDYVVEQSIGLVDVNGREIYEGDLVEGKLMNHFEFEGEIKRHKNMFIVELNDQVLLSQLNKYQLEIVGNIHQGRKVRRKRKSEVETK